MRRERRSREIAVDENVASSRSRPRLVSPSLDDRQMRPPSREGHVEREPAHSTVGLPRVAARQREVAPRFEARILRAGIAAFLVPFDLRHELPRHPRHRERHDADAL